jgi:hypothetical protein
MEAPSLLHGTWELRDEPAVNGPASFLVGGDSTLGQPMVVIQFLEFVSSIHLTPATARNMAASLLKHADAVEGKASS